MISMDPSEVTGRLRAVSEQVDLTTDRLETKIDMSPAGVTTRLREVDELLATCVSLRAAGTRVGG